MIDQIQERSRHSKAAALALLLFLPLSLFGAVLWAATGVAAVEPVPSLYLPIAVVPGEADPPPVSSPYAAALSQALADCASTALNEVCYASGSVTLDGGGRLTTPGQVASLTGVSGLTLVSPDAAHWSVALLRLAADSSTHDLGLALLAFGNVEIRNLTLFDAAVDNGDVAPALSFSSRPVPGEDPVTGALIVYNPDDEELLSIGLNGADLTLASSAVVQAQPGDKMTVTMATGSALIQTASVTNTLISGPETWFDYDALIQRYQMTLPLDVNGTVAGPPSTATVPPNNPLQAIASPDADNRLAQWVPPQSPPDYAALVVTISLNKSFFLDAYDRCMQGNSRQVYRIMYYARILQYYHAFYPDIVTNSLLAEYDQKLKQCATFEIEFNSDIAMTTVFASGSVYVQGQGMIVSYGMDGKLVQPAEMPLTHQRYAMKFPTGFSVVLGDGRLGHWEGYMRINRNRLDISTKIMPVGVTEQLILCCPVPMEVANSETWFNAFMHLHSSEFVGDGYVFTPAHWKYTGNTILAEAIFSRSVPFIDGVAEGDTWLVMLHKPGG